MKLLQKVVLMAMFTTYLLGAEHCIQVTGVERFNPHHIKPEILDILDNYDKARIDKRGNRLVLRVGVYRNASSARPDLRRIRRKYRDAYIRRCDYNPAKVVYPKAGYENQARQTQQRPLHNIDDKVVLDDFPDTRLEERPIKRDYYAKNRAAKSATHRPKPKPAFEYKRPKTYSDDLWRQCQRCFAPISDEANGNYQDDNNNDEEMVDDTMNDDAQEVIEEDTQMVKKDAQALKDTEVKKKKESKGWFSSLFSSDDEDDATEADDNDIEIELDDTTNDAAQSSESIFSDDQNNIEEPKAENTDVVEEDANYYAD